MTIDEKQLKKNLGNCHILIVEDDKELAAYLVELAGSFTKLSPITANTMETARSEAEKHPFDLAILDVMLPKTQKELDEIELFQSRLEELGELIRSARGRSKDERTQNMVEAARDERARLQKRIDGLLVHDGGIQLVEAWHKQGKDFPILFLTAVGSKEDAERGLQVASQHSDWIIKPSSSEEILEKCVTLMETKIS
jgi:DNA-binding response OmpR family regulator